MRKLRNTKPTLYRPSCRLALLEGYTSEGHQTWAVPLASIERLAHLSARDYNPWTRPTIVKFNDGMLIAIPGHGGDILLRGPAIAFSHLYSALYAAMGKPLAESLDTTSEDKLGDMVLKLTGDHEKLSSARDVDWWKKSPEPVMAYSGDDDGEGASWRKLHMTTRLAIWIEVDGSGVTTYATGGVPPQSIDQALPG